MYSVPAHHTLKEPLTGVIVNLRVVLLNETVEVVREGKPVGSPVAVVRALVSAFEPEGLAMLVELVAVEPDLCSAPEPVLRPVPRSWTTALLLLAASLR